MNSIVNMKFLSLMSTELIILFTVIIAMIIASIIFVRKELKNDR